MLVFSPQKQSFKTIIFQQTKSIIEQQECTSSDKTLNLVRCPIENTPKGGKLITIIVKMKIQSGFTSKACSKLWLSIHAETDI